MKFFLDTEFHEFKKGKRILGIQTAAIDTIDLISIGIVTETGETLYEICNEFDIEAAWNNEWLNANVLTKLFQDLLNLEKEFPFGTIDVSDYNVKNLAYLLRNQGSTKAVIAERVKNFVYLHSEINDPNAIANWEDVKHRFPVEFYGYYADYDWVVLCWLFGRMIDMPKGFPYYCKDLKQMFDEEGELGPDWMQENCPTPVEEHNALADAKWNLDLYNALMVRRLQKARFPDLFL
jgi:hypothetical protein